MNRKKAVVFILLVFFALMSMVKLMAIETSGIDTNLYVHDIEGNLTEETRENLRKTLLDFDIQTDIRVVIATYSGQDTAANTVNFILQEYLQEDSKTTVVIAFSRQKKVVGCSLKDIDSFVYTKRLLGVDSDEKYNENVSSIVNHILDEIAKIEKKNYKREREPINFSELIGEDDMSFFKRIILIASIIIVSTVGSIAITVTVLKLCLRELYRQL
mgnify:CR=1 FL=1